MVKLSKTSKGATESTKPPYQYLSQFYARHPELAEEQDIYFHEREVYLEQHKVPQLFNVPFTQRLLTELILDRPADVKAYVLKKLKDMQEFINLPNKEPPKLFESSDFDLMFEVFDQAHEGAISLEALVNAMANCTISNPREVLGREFPELNEESKISRQKFSQVLMKSFDLKGFE
jgi:Ca2+-binding EF-hand superfamily protein